MGTSGVSLVQLGPGRVDEFLTVRRQAGYTLWLSRKALVPLLNYLEGIGARPVTVEVPVPPPRRCRGGPATGRTFLSSVRSGKSRQQLTCGWPGLSSAHVPKSAPFGYLS